MRRPIFVLSATVALGLLLSACGGDDAETASNGESSGSSADTEPKSLTIYSARDSSITDFVIERFEQEHPEYEGNVEVLNLGAQEVLERVRAESANPQADVWWGGTQQGLAAAAEEDLLAAIEPAFAADIEDGHKDAEGRWFGEILLPEVIMYNNAALSAEEAPQDWDDLIDPQWEGDIIIRDVAASGTMRSIYAAMILKESPDPADPAAGYEWLTQLDANTGDYAANPADLYLKMSREQGIISAWNLQDILIQANQQNMPFDYVMPASGAPVLVDGVAAVNGGDTEAATEFLEFIFEDGLRGELAADFFQIPTVEISEQPQWLADLGLQPMEVDWDLIAQHETDWINHWNENIKNKG